MNVRSFDVPKKKKIMINAVTLPSLIQFFPVACRGSHQFPSRFFLLLSFFPFCLLYDYLFVVNTDSNIMFSERSPFGQWSGNTIRNFDLIIVLFFHSHFQLDDNLPMLFMAGTENQIICYIRQM